MSDLPTRSTFYIHQVRDGVRFIVDNDGAEFLSANEARDEAVVAARQAMAETLKHYGFIDFRNAFEIEDEDRQSIGVVWFSDAVNIKR